MKKNKLKLDRLSLIFSLLLFTFSILYAFFYFNKDLFSVPNTDYSLTESDKKDKGIKYSLKTYDAPNNYDLLDHRYINSLSNNGDLSIYDLELNKITDNIDGDIEIGTNHKLYLLKNQNGYLKLSIYNDDKFSEITDIDVNKGFKKVYYERNNTYYLIGVITNDDKEILYKIDDDKIFTIESDNYHFIGDTYDDSIIYISDPDYIVIAKDEDSNYGLYDIKNNKISINTNNQYIRTANKNSFIIYNDNKASIYDSNMNRLSITYDYIYKVFDHYVVIRDKRLTILDKNLKAISSMDYLIGEEDDSNLIYNNVFSYILYKDNLILIDKHNKVFLLNKDNKIYSKDIYNLYVGNTLYYIKDGKLYLLDEELNDRLVINLKDYFDDESIDGIRVELYGNTLKVDDYNKVYYFSNEDGTVKDNIEDYDINITESIKIKVKRVTTDDDSYNNVTLTVNDDTVEDLIIHDINMNKIIKKINNNYYLFTDNKIIRISKKG